MKHSCNFQKSNSKVFLKVIAFVLIFNLFAVNVFASDNILDKVKGIFKQYYIENVPSGVYDADNIEDAVKLLGDPYTVYFTKEEYQDFLNSIDMKFVGIGIYHEMIPEGVRVVSIIEGSPAKEAGLKEGDIIVSADGHSLEGMTDDEVRTYIVGKEGTTVRLDIKRGTEILSFTVERREIKTPTAAGTVLDKHIGYIELSSFGNDTAKEFYSEMQKLKSQKVDSYIIDLRDNPGGYMHAALDIGGYFIGEKTAMIIEDKQGNREKVNAYKHNEVIDKPVIFLTNEHSASASEILSAAVKDYGKAYFVGTNTYGKGVAQDLFEFDDGSALKTTTLRFYSPLGKVINHVGIAPDFETKDMDPLKAGELLLGNSVIPSLNGRYVKIKTGSKEFEINMNDIRDESYWDTYRYILSKSSTVSALGSVNTGKNVLPYLRVNSPVVKYNAGERISFKITAPNYRGRVQYRVILMDDTSKTARDLWTSGDRYYANWKPYGNEVFTLGFPITTPGKYRLKILVKRADITNSKTALRGLNCDSYLGEIPFVVQ